MKFRFDIVEGSKKYCQYNKCALIEIRKLSGYDSIIVIRLFQSSWSEYMLERQNIVTTAIKLFAASRLPLPFLSEACSSFSLNTILVILLLMMLLIMSVLSDEFVMSKYLS